MDRCAQSPEMDEPDRPLFPSERTFVLRFDRTADLAAGRWSGKLEEVATSGRHSFADVAELLEHLRKLVD